MEKKKTAKHVEEHFHKTYKAFDSFYGERKNIFARMIDYIFRRSMQMRYEKVIESIAPYENNSVLDVGCGTGRYSIALALKGIKKATGVDFAANMIEGANHLARKYKVDTTCEFLIADFMQQEFEGLFDHVFAMGVLDYIEDPALFVKRMMTYAKKSVMVSFPAAGGIIQKLRKFKFEKLQKCPVYFYTLEDIQKISQKVEARTIAIEKMAKDYFLTIYLT